MAMLQRRSTLKAKLSFVAIVQARMASTRLPGKVLKIVKRKPLLEHLIDRLRFSKHIDKIVIATSVSKKDDAIEKLGKKLGVECFRGSENDVLDRYYQAAVEYDADVIVRITADCPVIDPVIVDKMINSYKKRLSEYDYFSNVFPKRTYPRGLDVEMFTFDALKEAWKNAVKKPDREHVTPYIYMHPEKFRIFNYKDKRDFSMYRWTVDTSEDLKLIREIYNALYRKGKLFKYDEILSMIKGKPELIKINETVKQKEYGK